MESFSVTCSLPLRRAHSGRSMVIAVCNNFQLSHVRLKKWCVLAVSKSKALQHDQQDSSFKESDENPPKNIRRASWSRKRVTEETPGQSSADMIVSAEEKEKVQGEASIEASKKSTSGVGKKASTSLNPEEGNSEGKVTKRRTKRKKVVSEDQSMKTRQSDAEEIITLGNSAEGDQEEYKVQLKDDEEEDISFTYSWPPLVCCFGAAKHLFIPSGRMANRLIDHEIHESKKDMFWTPNKFVRAPGGSASSVAIAHASMGGRVAFMGRLGDDEYGETILYHLNVNKVQTRAIKIDSSRSTALSQMKVSKRGGLKATCVKPCAEDCFMNSDINIDVLKEGKMFYFNSSSLLVQTTRSTAMEAIRISKKYGGVIFFDLNLPLPLWKSRTETNLLIQDAWNTADIIEVTKQELEFLCGIEPAEKFYTKDNDKSKFTHYKPDVVKQLWHDNLKVLFVTNGTSKIHYYTVNDNDFVRGMEDAPITPFTGDMSVSGDAIVAETQVIEVKPGWKKGTKITFPKMGDQEPNKITADVVFEVEEKPHDVYMRAGNDLVVHLKISLADALGGTTIKLQTLDDRELIVQLTNVVTPGFELLIAKEGMPMARDPGNKGNLKLKFDVVFPLSLTEEQREGIRNVLQC